MIVMVIVLVVAIVTTIIISSMIVRNSILAQDKGGPSKGDLLIHLLFSYTDLYLCNEINGVCT